MSLTKKIYLTTAASQTENLRKSSHDPVLFFLNGSKSAIPARTCIYRMMQRIDISPPQKIPTVPTGNETDIVPLTELCPRGNRRPLSGVLRPILARHLESTAARKSNEGRANDFTTVAL